ncbi:MAG: FecR domain-containing protein [Chitinophagaceae bacterium]|nr:FecR domain-containing protein [Chitinophagaceae bacterium]
MLTSRLTFLFNKYILQQCSAEEEEELMAFFADPANRERVGALIDGVIGSEDEGMVMNASKAASILENIIHPAQPESSPGKSVRLFDAPWKKMLAAASVALLIFSMSFLFWNSDHPEGETGQVFNSASAVVLPGGDRATLTMSDGSVVVLDSLQNGLLSQQGNTEIKKEGTSLIYRDAGSPVVKVPVFNILTTPRGGQYRINLPDGSRVWLNAASSLRFPVAFSGNTREVELAGEAYFEIAHNQKKPFRVRVGDMRVEVTGTHFNINAYDDEKAIKTSLLEGGVRVTKNKVTRILEPGQQALWIKTGDKMEIDSSVDMNGVIAWKTGLFQFEGAEITTIMRQISRWYDVDIEYRSEVSKRHFEGKISRSAPLSDVLHILELNGLKFKVEGKKIILQ